MRILPLLLLLIGLAQTVSVHAQKRSMLVYTKNGKGYVHDNIPAAVEALKQIGQDEKIKVVVSDDPGIFTEDQLNQFSLLVFPSTNNDVFDTDAQRLAFRRYIEAGGGLVGIHSITGTERNWTWFKMLIGCTFSWHANFQTFTVRVTDPQHPSMKDVPLLWQREDELYFGKELYPVTNVMMSHQISTLHPKQKNRFKKMQAPIWNTTLLFGTTDSKAGMPGSLHWDIVKSRTRILCLSITCDKEFDSSQLRLNHPIFQTLMHNTKTTPF